MKKIALLILAGVLCAGCQKGNDEKGSGVPALPSVAQPFVPAGSDEDQVRQTVARYDQLIIEGYRTLNMNPLAEVATQDQAEKAYVHMAAIGEGQVRMLSTLKKLDFTSVKRDAPDTFTVRTRELWDFAYTDIKTGKETGKVTDFVYEVTYTLKKTGPRWIITDTVAYAPNDKEEKVAPRVIKPAGDERGAALPAGHPKVGK